MAKVFSHETNSLPAIVAPVPALRRLEVGYARQVADLQSAAPYRPVYIIRLPEVIERIGLCRASIYSHIAKGTFPKPISLGARAVGWLEHEIDAWLASRVSARGGNI